MFVDPIQGHDHAASLHDAIDYWPVISSQPIRRHDFGKVRFPKFGLEFELAPPPPPLELFELAPPPLELFELAPPPLELFELAPPPL